MGRAGDAVYHVVQELDGIGFEEKERGGIQLNPTLIQAVLHV